jgi:aminoglycoside 6'-N-acetyltransferase I
MIRLATLEDLDEWSDLRHALWPSSTVDEHRRELLTILQSCADDLVAFIDIDEEARISGIAEAALRRDHVNGCEPSPVAYLEGIYVRPDARGAGVGRSLGDAVEAWARKRGCTELASDTSLDNAQSQAFPGAIGFEETERTIFFRKRL